MKTEQELSLDVLACANKVARTSLSMPPDGDLSLEAFNFDSLSLFAFILELEQTCGIEFDDALLNHERLRSVRSAAALIASCGKEYSPRFVGAVDRSAGRASKRKEG
jgi:acyl carrier protein